MAPSEKAGAPTESVAQRSAAPQPTPCHLDVKAADAAARLLNGAGSMTVVCHDGTRGYTLDTALHGAALDGTRYLVVAPAAGQWPAMDVERPQRVAMTVTADAPLPEIRMNIAELSGHAVLTRCSEDEEAELFNEGPQPSVIARAFACWPGAQLWRVEPLRMTIHHVHGCHALDREALMPRSAWPTPQGELDTIEALRGEWGPHLSGIITELRAASSLTAAFPEAPGSPRCATGRAYPVAVSDHELTLLMVDGPQRETVVVPLRQRVGSIEEFVEGVWEVVHQAASSRST